MTIRVLFHFISEFYLRRPILYSEDLHTLVFHKISIFRDDFWVFIPLFSKYILFFNVKLTLLFILAFI